MPSNNSGIFPHRPQQNLSYPSPKKSPDIMNVKRVRFKDPVTKASQLTRHGFDACPASCETTEAPQSSNDPKTSEYAFFKKLKQDARSTCRRIPVDSESTHSRKLRTGNNFVELSNAKYKEVKSAFYVEKPAVVDADSFMSLKDSAQEHSSISSKTHDDHARFKSSSVLRTPSIELDSFLSTSGYSFTKPENQLKDGDVFSSKRLKLSQWIAKTLFPETEEVPKGCDVVCLLLCRLLPEESENISENPNMKLAETKDTSQLHGYPDSHMQLVENRNSSMDAEKCCFLGSGGSAAWSLESKGRFPSSQSFEGIDSCAVRCADGMLVGYRKMNERENSPNDIGSACWSNRIGDGNLLTWRNDYYDHSTYCWPNRLVDKNIWVPRKADHDFLTTCNTNSDITKHGMHHWLSYDGMSSQPSLRSVDITCSYGFPTESYSSFAAIDEGTDLKHKDQRFDCNLDRRAALSTDGWCHSAYDGSYGNSGLYESSNPRAELNEFEIRREPSPLLLGWCTDQTNMSELSYASDMELVTSPLPSSARSEHHLYSVENDTTAKTFSASYSYWDQYIQNQDLEDQINLVARSRCSSLATSSYDLKQLEQNDGGFFKNIIRDHSFLFLPKIHQLSAENLEALLLCEGAYSDSGLKCQPLTHISETQYNESTDNVLQLLRRDNQSSQFLIENENDLAMSRPENWSVMSVHNPVAQEVSFPLQHQKLRWFDSEVETNHADWSNF